MLPFFIVVAVVIYLAIGLGVAEATCGESEFLGIVWTIWPLIAACRLLLAAYRMGQWIGTFPTPPQEPVQPEE